MAGRRKEASKLDAVDFMCNEFAEWALFWVNRPDWGASGRHTERLYARKVGPDRITFGNADYSAFEEGSPRTPSREGARSFRISTLRRVLDGTATKTHGGRFNNRTADSVTYTTSCGQVREVRLEALREIVEDAEALP